jgi:sterol desaturase/sphingolipid hydroxylase (fatty acid hydroxylase superfamily)
VVGAFQQTSHAFLGGFVCGYMLYDTVHYYLGVVIGHLHHGETFSFTQYNKKYHMYHHYKNAYAGFGISTMIWDRVFGTELDLSKKG